MIPEPTLDLGSVQLPLSAATRTFAILAKRGAGKSYTAGVMEEEMAKHGIPFVTFDPIDVHWGLRLKAYNEAPIHESGFPIVVFGVLDNADIKLTDDMGEKIARAVVEKNISCVISTFGMSKKGQRRLIAEFAETLIRINNTQRHIFIEEAHEFVPQRVGSDLGRCFSAVEALVVMGRNRGLGVTLINQRAATINKDVLTQIDTLLAFRNIAPQDRNALREWVEVHADTKDFEAFWKSLPDLPTGEGWLWSPEWLQKFERIKIRERETFHPSFEKSAHTVPMPKIDQINVKDFIDSFTMEVKPLKVTKQDREAKKMLDKHAEDLLKPFVLPKVDPKDERIKQLEGEVQSLRTLLSKIVTIAGGVPKEQVQIKEVDTVFEMWLEKIGRTNSAGKILQLLIDKKGLRLTKHQVRTLVGISAKSSGFSSAVRFLKRNNLIIEENDCLLLNGNL